MKRSDEELYDFTPEGDFGLFGEHGVSIESVLSNGDDTDSVNGSPLQQSPPREKVTQPSLYKQQTRKRKSKEWNEMEKDLFLKGIELFGENWMKISKFITTKTASQVKSYHTQWAETANVIPDSAAMANDTSIYLPLVENDHQYFASDIFVRSQNDSNNIKEEIVVKTENIDNASAQEVAFDGCGGIVVSPLNDWDLGSVVSVTEVETSSNLESLEIAEPSSSPETLGELKKKRRQRVPNVVTKRKYSAAKRKTKFKKTVKSNAEANVESSDIAKGQIIHLNKDEDEDSDVNIDDSDDDNRNLSSSSGAPSNQKNLSQWDKEIEVLSDQEKEFYLNKISFIPYFSSKDYMSIRNQIINEWHECAPANITKRRIIRKVSAGNDLLLVYKIFDFLEWNQLINGIHSGKSSNKDPSQSKDKSPRLLPPRFKSSKKNIVNNKNSSNLPNGGGGVTMSHDATGAVVNTIHIPDDLSKNVLKKVKTKVTKLQVCKRPDANAVPVTGTKICFDPAALVALQLHCHSSTREVIGLLGGIGSPQKIDVMAAVPASSAPTSGVECEMCPVSQTEALEALWQRDLRVVGWYHSHPTFSPNPSTRDSTTQSRLQEWFNSSTSLPFIGVISSPYGTVVSDASLLCFVVGHDRQPYQLDWNVSEPEGHWMEWMNSLEDVQKAIFDTHADNQSREDTGAVSWLGMLDENTTYLDKLTSTLRAMLPSSLASYLPTIASHILSDS